MTKLPFILLVTAAVAVPAGLRAAQPVVSETQAAIASAQQGAAALVDAARNQAMAPLNTARGQALAQATSARNQAAAPVDASRNQALAQTTAARGQIKDKLKLPFNLPKFDVPDLVRAAKARHATVDAKVKSPRTLTYKSRFSRIARWIAPFTMGLIVYIPFDSMNAQASGTMNNLMAEQGISVESMAAGAFANQIKDGKRWTGGEPADGVFKVEVNRYALDPIPTSISLLRPTVSLTGRLFDNDGKLLWIGKGFTSSLEPGIKGATLEQYEANPAMLRADFETAVRVAASRLAAQANALPRAKVTVAPVAKTN
ncbi:MAG: hypothetical protein FGM15_02560 [Chthoniobacterales bacterium]|nr:hypothetical protein [Chthoniobacterales bacterium]